MNVIYPVSKQNNLRELAVEYNVVHVHTHTCTRSLLGALQMFSAWMSLEGA